MLGQKVRFLTTL